MILRWDPLAREDQNAPGVYYKLYYKKKDEISFKITKTKEMRRLGNVGLYTVRVELKDYWTPFIVKIQVGKGKRKIRITLLNTLNARCSMTSV